MTEKTSCQHCGTHLEFDVENIDQFVPCPNCGNQTRLLLPTKPRPLKQETIHSKTSFEKFGLVLLVIIIIGASIPTLVYISGKFDDALTKTGSQTTHSPSTKQRLLTADEKTARDNILKILLEMQSAASLGVTYDRYGELLIKADSTLNFEKTKLPDPDYRHSQYLSYAKDAIRNYSKANEAWNSYLKYEWMREKKQALMHDWNFRDLRECGVNVDETTYPPALNIKGAYLVPFNECLSLYWKAADIIIEKMKGEISK